MQEHDIIKALKARYQAPWLFYPKLKIGNGFDRQEIDGFAIHTWPSKAERLAFEVKVSRSDFLAEIKNPVKRLAAQLLATEFIFVTPENLVSKTELPNCCGLFWVKEDGRIEQKYRIRNSVHLDGLVAAPSWDFVTRLLRDLAFAVPGFAAAEEERVLKLCSPSTTGAA